MRSMASSSPEAGASSPAWSHRGALNCPHPIRPSPQFVTAAHPRARFGRLRTGVRWRGSPWRPGTRGTSAGWARWRWPWVSARRSRPCRWRRRIRRVPRARPGRVRTRPRGRPRRDQRVGPSGPAGNPRARTLPVAALRPGLPAGRAAGPQPRRSARTTRRRGVAPTTAGPSRMSRRVLIMHRPSPRPQGMPDRIPLRRNRSWSQSRGCRIPLLRLVIR